LLLGFAPATLLEFKYVGSEIIAARGTVGELRPNQGLTVPKGVVHRTRAPEHTAILMFESATVTPTGDA
jgi:mannose-6-phosphate isomerase-like protein (cupin superfamily)